jgi:hypothetical protein
MSVRAFTLVDADASPSIPPEARFDRASTGVSLSAAPDWSVDLRTLRGGLSDGVQVVEIACGPLSLHILPTRGMGLWKAACRGVVAGWSSPVRRPVHPRHVNLSARNGLGWLDGFNELLCRCGLAFNGPPGADAGARSPIESGITLHGRIANLPAHRVTLTLDDSGPGRVVVAGEVDELTMFGPQLRLVSSVAITAGATTIEIDDRVENLGASPTELELLYHINVGPPFLDGGARLCAPARVVAPRDPRAAEGIAEYDRYLPPTPGYAEQAYFLDLASDARGETAALLHNAAGERGFAVRYDRRSLPCFTQWKCTQPEADGYVTGLEPGTNYPNFKSFEREQGRVVVLPGGEAHQTRLAIDLHTTAGEVARAREHIEAISGELSPRVHPQPAAGFSPLT